VAESNSISNSGRPGVSDVFAAALWTLDGSFEVAQAGAVGINFHQGAGQNLYAAIIRWCVHACVYVCMCARVCFVFGVGKGGGRGRGGGEGGGGQEKSVRTT
jgi:hypothetical protein